MMCDTDGALHYWVGGEYISRGSFGQLSTTKVECNLSRDLSDNSEYLGSYFDSQAVPFQQKSSAGKA